MEGAEDGNGPLSERGVRVDEAVSVGTSILNVEIIARNGEVSDFNVTDRD